MTPKDWPGTAVEKVSCASTANPERPRSGLGGATTAVSVTPERLDDGAVELRLLYSELMEDIVFCFGREIGGSYFLHQ